MGQFEELGTLITNAGEPLQSFTNAVNSLITEDGAMTLEETVKKIVDDAIAARFPEDGENEAGLPIHGNSSTDQMIGFSMSNGNDMGLDKEPNSLGKSLYPPYTMNGEIPTMLDSQPNELSELKSDVASIGAKANDALKKAIMLSAEINQATANANQAKGIAMKALSNASKACNCKPSNQSVADSDSESPSYI